MIAGLLRNRNTNNINKAPFLGDLPILGALFRSTSFRRDETELVIIVTPYLVRPVSGQLADCRRDGYRAPDRRHSASGRARPTAAERPPVGSGTGSGARLRAAQRPPQPRGSSCDPPLHQEGCQDAFEVCSSARRSGGNLPAAAYKPGPDPDARRDPGQRAGRHPRRLCVRRGCSGRRRLLQRKPTGSTPGSAASAWATATAIYVEVAPMPRPRARRSRAIAGQLWHAGRADGAPVTAGAVLLRARSGWSSAARLRVVPDCPNWSVQAQPNYNNKIDAELRLRREREPRRDGRQPRGPGPRA